MGMKRRRVCLAAEGRGEGHRGEAEGRVGGAGSKRETEMESKGNQAFSNHFGTLGRRDCPGGTKSLGCSL